MLQLQPGQSPPSVSDMPMNPIGAGVGIVAGPGRDFFLSRLPQTLRNFMTKMPEVVYVKPPAPAKSMGDTAGLFTPTLATQLIPKPVPAWDKVIGTIEMGENMGPTTAIHEALHALWTRKNLLRNNAESANPVLGQMRPFPARWLPIARSLAEKDKAAFMDTLAQFATVPKGLQAPEAVVESLAINALIGGARKEPALMEYVRKMAEEGYLR